MSMRTGELTSPLSHIPGVARVRGIYPVVHPLLPVMGRRASLRGMITDEMVLSHTKCSNTENGSVPHLGKTVMLALWYESRYQRVPEQQNWPIFLLSATLGAGLANSTR